MCDLFVGEQTVFKSVVCNACYNLPCVAEVFVHGVSGDGHCGDVFDGKQPMGLLQDELKKLESVSSGGKDVVCIYIACCSGVCLRVKCICDSDDI